MEKVIVFIVYCLIGFILYHEYNFSRECKAKYGTYKIMSEYSSVCISKDGRIIDSI